MALSLGACASTSTTEYYEAMERAALAQAKVQEARYNALSRIAGEGNEAELPRRMVYDKSNLYSSSAGTVSSLKVGV